MRPPAGSASPKLAPWLHAHGTRWATRYQHPNTGLAQERIIIFFLEQFVVRRSRFTRRT